MNISGAMWMGVPLKDDSKSFYVDILANPKSPIFTSNLLLMNIFSNFKSQWTISASWSAFKPSAICLKYFLACYSGKLKSG